MSQNDRKLHREAALTAGRPAPHIPPRRTKANVIRDDAEAIAVAKELARDFAAGATARDRERRLPIAEIERFSQAGLWAITVPKDLGLLVDTIELAPGAVCTSPIQTYLDLSIAGERGTEAAEHLRQERLSWPK